MAFKQKHYRHPSLEGVWSTFPWSKPESEKEKVAQYTSLDRCPRCEKPHPLRFVRSNKCASCAELDRSEFSRNRFFGKPLPDRDDRVYEPTEDHPFRGQRICVWGPHEEDPDPDNGSCRGCARELGRVSLSAAQQLKGELGDDLTREQAKEQGYRLFLGGFCPEGHPGWRYVATGRCYYCTRDEEPTGQLWTKEEAEGSGSPRYYSDKPCDKGHLGWRRVADDGCEECERPRLRPGRQAGAPKQPAQKVNRRIRESRLPHPETIIDRESAYILGWTFYRTGEPCRHGHTGFRYTKTAQCIDCIAGKPAVAELAAQPKQRRTTLGRPLSPDAQMARDNPDMVLSREDARLVDLSLYRTGKPCRHGHAGWRRVDTGACTECLKRK